MVKGMWHVVIVVLVCTTGAVMASDVSGTPDRVLGPPEVTESASGPAAAGLQSTAEGLQALTAAERLNARISLDGADALGEVERQQARQVEALWAQGRYEEAISLLSQLEAGGAVLAAGISWRQPVASEPKSRGADARIGGTREHAEDVALDFHQATGNLFAVVAWTGSSPGWTVNISTDGGVSWAETYSFGTTSFVDAAVADQYLYVTYAPSGQAGVHIRRFFVADGAWDFDYGTQVFTGSGYPAWDVSAGANADSSNDRVFCAFIDSFQGEVRFFWAVASDGEEFFEYSPTGVVAYEGLDFHWGGGTLGSDPNLLWLSYLGGDAGVHVLGAKAASGWNHYSLGPHPLGGIHATRISAFKNTVFVAYTAEGTHTSAAAYHVSYDNGGSWQSGFAYDPLAGAPGCWGTDITARGGWGSSVIFNSESGAFDYVYAVTREDYAPGSPWNTPENFNEFDAYSGGPSFIQYLRPQGALGMVYLADAPSGPIPYFDVIALMPFDDGFDYGDTSAWSDMVP